jgi:hypothetical protein
MTHTHTHTHTHKTGTYVLMRGVVCFTATQCVPTFVQEIVDLRAVELETVTFECQFSGTPTPGKFYISLNVCNNYYRISPAPPPPPLVIQLTTRMTANKSNKTCLPEGTLADHSWPGTNSHCADTVNTTEAYHLLIWIFHILCSGLRLVVSFSLRPLDRAAGHSFSLTL